MSTLKVNSIESSSGGGVNIIKGFNRRPPLHRGPLFTKTTATTLSVVADCSLNGFFYSSAYTAEADPLFFKYQAGEVTKEEWLAKREEIRSRYPYPS